MAKILLVDDEPGILDALGGILSIYGHDVDGVQSADEGREKFEAGHFDIVLTDYGLPGENGLDFYYWIKEQSPEQRVIIITGKNPSLPEGIEVCAKPISAKDILKLIEG